MEQLKAAFPAMLLERLRTGTCSQPHSTDFVELARQRADRENREPGTLSGYNCPECLNRGYFHRVDEFGRSSITECVCMIRRRNERRIRVSGLGEMLERYTFPAWIADTKWRESAKAAAMRYAEKPSGWFVVAGTSGTGKSHLCTAICGCLMEQGVDTRYMLWRDVSVQAKAVVNDDDAYSRIVEPLKRIPALYIDDLFKTGRGQAPTVGDVNLAFEILNARYNDSRKITIISTERPMEALLDIDEAVGSRIYERSKGNYLDFRGRENWRLR